MTVFWQDLGSYHCYDGFFQDALAMYEGLSAGRPFGLTSTVNCLSSAELWKSGIAGECLQPSGFIFHAGRCGSTLLVKSLARSRRNLVFGEASAHNQVWAALPIDAEESTRTYRDLLTLMGRRRLPSYRAHIVKFTSFNIMQYRLIRSAFPQVPALFLYREPGAIIASCQRRAPGWLTREPVAGKRWQLAEDAIEEFFRSALLIDDADFRCLNYEDLSTEALPSILRFFGLEATRDELQLMSSEFGWDAKSGPAPKPFVRAAPVPPGPERLTELYERLKGHVPLNL